MQLHLQPDLQRFIDEQVKAGNFPSPEAVIEASLAQMMEYQVELTEDDIAAINLSEAQLDRGEGISSKEVAARMRAMYRRPQDNPATT